MNQAQLKASFEAACAEPLPLPGAGQTAARHLRLYAVAMQDVSLAKLAEAHWDALAILAEAGRTPVAGALYAVWASEIPGKPLQVDGNHLSGNKAFCTGFGLVQRALVTVGGEDGRLLDIDVRPSAAVQSGDLGWYTEAFRDTSTGPVIFREVELEPNAVIGAPGFYVGRPGFWHGACGPAACWAGGAAGLLASADRSSRRDPHTLAHLAAMHANAWTMQAVLRRAGEEIDANPSAYQLAQQRALTVRHSIEQLASDTLHRFARAYGPYPLSMQADTARRYQEVDLFLRQCHGERDLEGLAHLLAAGS